MDYSLVAGIAVPILAAVGFLLWYRQKIGGRPVPEILRPGQSLPDFAATDEHGNSLNSETLRGNAAVILFVRGNWCPFCSRQVANLTKHYKEINDLGARLILITPKPLETTRRVAEFFEFDFEFWLDDDLAIAGKLGLVQSGGVPAEQRREYGDDTIWPAAIVVDKDGLIRYASVSKFIADRPDPQKLVHVLTAI